MLVLYGGKDDVVPPTYNCNRFAVFYKSAGGNPENLRMIGEPSRGDHPHGVKADDDTIVITRDNIGQYFPKVAWMDVDYEHGFQPSN